MRRAPLTTTALALAVALAGCSGPEDTPSAGRSASEAPSSHAASTEAHASTPEPGTSSVESSASPAPTTGAAAPGVEQARDVDSADSPTVVVNKARPLDPIDYAPTSLEAVDGVLLRTEAAEALEALRADAAAAGHRLTVLSGYRSHARQRQVYAGWVARHGGVAAADRVSARAGHSEHQTGLAVDVGDAATPGCDLAACFGATAAGRWVAAHAHDHGFVVRYPAGSESVTGFSAEPWHLRWLGTEHAAAVREAGGVVETAFGVPAAPDYLD